VHIKCLILQNLDYIYACIHTIIIFPCVNYLPPVLSQLNMIVDLDTTFLQKKFSKQVLPPSDNKTSYSIEYDRIKF
jgi:hypothetical protein